MELVTSIIGILIAVLLVYAFGVAIWIKRRVRNLAHERYDKRHVYAVFPDGSHYHIPREILELYMHIKDPRIQEKTGDPPNPKVFASWGYALVLPRIASKIIRPFSRE
jgi:hypothetical protein